MNASRSRREFLVALVLCAAGWASAFLPEATQSRVRQAVRDTARPGQVAVAWTVNRTSRAVQEWASRIAGHSPPGIAVDDETVAELGRLRLESRRLELQNAQLQEQITEMRLTGALPYRGDAGEPLIVAELLDAAILGRENGELVRSGGLLDAGSAAGVGESSLVLDDPRPLLDQGENANVAVAHSVLAGRCVVGRIAAVGRNVSTLQPLDDPGFRGLAQIVRRTPGGAVFGAEGLIEGRGDGCRMTLVPSTEAVIEGDEVYTAGRDANTPSPMLYGTIVAARLPPGAAHWEIEVKPSVRIDALRHVQIVRKRLNPARGARRTGLPTRPEGSGDSS